ncbi:MAG: DEAD/DEAH box helicase [Leptospiraceae bacterium]|nr:DEAD/DEAH box helicase [Leptospiraceae bacterium]MCZ8348030.1 DEAD/DEAH box helicase [Leptospiraceae bacterium]
MQFTELNLNPILQDNLKQSGFVELTKIQEQAIPFALEGKDIAGLAQTGTGKTLAFLTPAIHEILTSRPDSGLPSILVLAPTRELVLQISGEANKLLKNTDYGVATIIGGTDYKSQEQDLVKNPGVVVATPGRLIDFVKSRSLDLSQVRTVVIDEADRMFDMGFVQDLKYVFHKCKDRKQTMLFSATLSSEVIRLAYKYLDEPVEVQIDPDKIISERIDQKLYHLGRDEKLSYLVNLILSDTMDGLGIIFTNYKSNIPLIIRTLHRYGISTAGLSSDFDQKKRIRLLKDFKLGKYKMMVATDVASRGIDVESIQVVYNYDLPSDSENYVHRIGRTARAGRKGKSISFCSESDYQELERIEKYLKGKIPTEAINEDFLVFPKGDFIAFESDDPAITKSLNEKPSYSKVSNGKGRRDKNPRGENREHKPREREKPVNNRETDVTAKSKSDFPKQNKHQTKFKSDSSQNKKNYSQANKNANYASNKSSDKSKRNLFDIEETRQNTKSKKNSFWSKFKSLFGF